MRINNFYVGDFLFDKKEKRNGYVEKIEIIRSGINHNMIKYTLVDEQYTNEWVAHQKDLEYVDFDDILCTKVKLKIFNLLENLNDLVTSQTFIELKIIDYIEKKYDLKYGCKYAIKSGNIKMKGYYSKCVYKDNTIYIVFDNQHEGENFINYYFIEEIKLLKR